AGHFVAHLLGRDLFALGDAPHRAGNLALAGEKHLRDAIHETTPFAGIIRIRSEGCDLSLQLSDLCWRAPLSRPNLETRMRRRYRSRVGRVCAIDLVATTLAGPG